MPHKSTVQQLIFSISVKPMQYSYIGISKAFDTVSHVHLPDKLASVDIDGDLWL